MIFRPSRARKPAVVRPALELASLAPSDIDVAVSSHLRASESLYAVDEALLRSLDPDLILTQDLCQVCAPSGNDVTRVLGSLDRSPDVMYFTPRELADVWRDLRALGRRERHAGDRRRDRRRRRAAASTQCRALLRAPIAAARVFRRMDRSDLLCGPLGAGDDRARRRCRSARAPRGRFGSRVVGRGRRVRILKS